MGPNKIPTDRTMEVSRDLPVLLSTFPNSLRRPRCDQRRTIGSKPHQLIQKSHKLRSLQISWLTVRRASDFQSNSSTYNQIRDNFRVFQHISNHDDLIETQKVQSPCAQESIY